MKKQTSTETAAGSVEAAQTVGARFVAFGGGTGMSTLLRGLKKHSDNITAIVAVSDDGGSSGRLRKDYDIPPPGDIRNCLVALCDAGELIEQLFQYRFEETDLKGHSFGNLFLTALTKVTGDFQTALQEANRILRVRGKVLPAAPTKVALIAHHADGSKSTGEKEISRSKSEIVKISLRPEQEPISAELREAIDQAEVILLGPGSLFTSVIPTLLGPDTAARIRASRAYKVYVCNVMTQPGETLDYSVADHIRAIERHVGQGLIDCVLVNTGEIPEALGERYAREGAVPVTIDEEEIDRCGVQLVSRDIGCSQDYVRHDSDRLADAIRTILTQRSRCE